MSKRTENFFVNFRLFNKLTDSYMISGGKRMKELQLNKKLMLLFAVGLTVLNWLVLLSPGRSIVPLVVTGGVTLWFSGFI